LKRLETPDKVNGKVQYRHRCHAPGVKFGHLGPFDRNLAARWGSVDDTKAKTLQGVAGGCPDDLARWWATYGAAKQGLADTENQVGPGSPRDRRLHDSRKQMARGFRNRRARREGTGVILPRHE